MSSSSHSLPSLLELIRHLRSSEGCPWDREQRIDDIRAYLLEEAHEVGAAIDAGDWNELGDELGDLLFQIGFIVVLAEEESAFDLAEVVRRIEDKMIHRHPHVFGSEELEDSDAVHQAWEQRKLDDAASRRQSLLDGLPASLPALLAAHRMTQKVAGVGFDWPDADAVIAKVDEELNELKVALDEQPDGDNMEQIRAEVGDLLFTLVNLSRHLGMDAEAVLARANNKFRHRFASMEARLKRQGGSFADLDPEAMDALWRAAKQDDEV